MAPSPGRERRAHRCRVDLEQATAGRAGAALPASHGAPVPRLRQRWPSILGANTGKRNQRLGVVCRRAFGLHCSAREVRIDRRVPRGDGMSPAGALDRRQPQCGQREGRRVHRAPGRRARRVRRPGSSPRWPKARVPCSKTCGRGRRAARAPSGTASRRAAGDRRRSRSACDRARPSSYGSTGRRYRH